jgi:hypothetical protein
MISLIIKELKGTFHKLVNFLRNKFTAKNKVKDISSKTEE